MQSLRVTYTVKVCTNKLYSFFFSKKKNCILKKKTKKHISSWFFKLLLCFVFKNHILICLYIQNKHWSSKKKRFQTLRKFKSLSISCLFLPFCPEHMNYSYFWATLSERVDDALTVGWTISARVDGLVENPFSIPPPREPHNRKGKRSRSVSSSFLRVTAVCSSLLHVHWCTSSMLLWPGVRYLCLPVANMSE